MGTSVCKTPRVHRDVCVHVFILEFGPGEGIVWFQGSLHSRKWTKLSRTLASCRIAWDLDIFPLELVQVKREGWELTVL